MPWQNIDIPETTDLRLTEAQEAGLKAICSIYNYPYQLLSPQQSFNMSQYGNYLQQGTTEQKVLDALEVFDAEGSLFLQNVDNWSNHRPLLLLALSITGGDVYEFGCGDGSTSYLRKFCETTCRRFRSFESNEVWALRCGAEFVKNWDDDMLYWPCSVAFVDHAPGEHRHIAVKRLAEFADIIVIHDTEEGGTGNYQFEKIWHLFKYRLNYNKTGGGAGATAVSNKIDLNQFRGLKLGQYQFDND